MCIYKIYKFVHICKEITRKCGDCLFYFIPVLSISYLVDIQNHISTYNSVNKFCSPVLGLAVQYRDE